MIGLYDEVEVELLFEIRQLAVDMIRLDGWASDAAERRRFDRVADLHWQRELAMERRSRLMRELWRIDSDEEAICFHPLSAQRDQRRKRDGRRAHANWLRYSTINHRGGR